MCSTPKQQRDNRQTKIDCRAKTMNKVLCLAHDALEHDFQIQNTKHICLLYYTASNEEVQTSSVSMAEGMVYLYFLH